MIDEVCILGKDLHIDSPTSNCIPQTIYSVPMRPSTREKETLMI